MKKSVLFFSLFIFNFQILFAQSYADSIYAHREKYKLEFLEEKRSPLKEADTSFLRFFKPDSKYRIVASLILTPDDVPFEIPTSSGKKKMFRKYGVIRFRLKGKNCSLEVYQNMSLMNDSAHHDHLFIPFKDLTNYKETYGGGRYIDLSIKDVVNNTLLLDFNKCYNPWCAFASGYNCPIPPDANILKLVIKAGEKNYGRKHED